MDFKEILIAEEIDKVFVSSIPRTDGFRKFIVYFIQMDEELEYDENIEYEGDIENIIANVDKVFSECFGSHSIEHTLKSLIMDAIHEEYRIMFEDYPYSIFE